jgi:hypothetical protein
MHDVGRNWEQQQCSNINKKMLLPSSTSGKQVEEKDLTLISLISLSNEDYKNQNEDGSMENWICNMRHEKMSTSVIIIMFVSLLLISSLFESRDEILFKGVDL